MPKTAIDYSKSCIYKICCKDTNITDCYIGSTTNFTKRKYGHKSFCYNQKNKHYNMKIYQFIRDNGGWTNWDMVLVEKVNVNDGYELHKEERKWIEQLNSTLNSYIPARTMDEYHKEYYENNKEEKLQYQKEYIEKNKDKIKENLKEYRQKNKDKIKEKNKKYYEKNKEEILQYQKQHYQDNKEKILEKNKKQLEKVECPICNSLITKSNLGRHQKSKKCMNAK